MKTLGEEAPKETIEAYVSYGLWSVRIGKARATLSALRLIWLCSDWLGYVKCALKRGFNCIWSALGLLWCRHDPVATKKNWSELESITLKVYIKRTWEYLPSFAIHTPSIYQVHFKCTYARGSTWFKFCWVCAAGLSEPLPHYSLFCWQLQTPS